MTRSAVSSWLSEDGAGGAASSPPDSAELLARLCARDADALIFDEQIHLRQLQLRLWRNARVIYDVGMQTGRTTRDEAITLMTDQVGFLRWAADSEIDAALSRPGYFIGYFMGMSEILEMREAFRQRRAALTRREARARSARERPR